MVSQTVPLWINIEIRNFHEKHELDLEAWGPERAGQVKVLERGADSRKEGAGAGLCR